MASLWQKTLFYLGLVDEDQIDEDVAFEEPPSPDQSAVKRVEPPRPMRPPTRPSGTATPTTTPPRTTGMVAGRRVEPPARQRRRMSANPSHAEAGVLVQDAGGNLQPLPPRSADEAEVIVARTFSDAQTLADHIRSGRPVVLDLRTTEPEMVRRLVDFSSGLTYALDGKMAKIGPGVILVTPSGVSIGVEERQRLADLGLYTVPSGS